MERKVAFYGFLVVLAVCWNALVHAEPGKLPRLKRTFARRPIANIAVAAFADRLNRKWNVPRGTLDPIAGLSEK